VWSLLSPSQLLLGAACLGALCLLLGWHRIGRWLCLSAGLGLLLFGVLPLAHYLALPLESRFPQPRLPRDLTGIVLLAGAERPAATEYSGEPQLNVQGSRYVTTLRLLHAHPESRLLFTGGPAVDPASGRLAQTGVAQRILSSIGIEPTRVVFEEASADTCESAVNARARLQPAETERWVVVTSALHMPRTVACFRAAGWAVIPQPADYRVVPGPWNMGSFNIVGNLALLDAALHEWLGLAYYRASGRTGEVFPAP
jgi:uncharacterized SAM-binding protein YcdF (DUF218 family)